MSPFPPKLIKKLHDKKNRTESGLFLVEGEKNITELLLSDLSIKEIVGTKKFLDAIGPLITKKQRGAGAQRITLTIKDEEYIEKIGTLHSNNAGIAVVNQNRPIETNTLLHYAQNDFLLALSDISDPGNLGTIIRIADWFGVKHIIASISTTDVYNPKVIAASMGSFTRVSVTHGDLGAFFAKAKCPIIGADLEGKNIHDGELPKNGILLMGSESHGIADELHPLITEKVTIQRYGDAESLNVAVATGIILDALRR